MNERLAKFFKTPPQSSEYSEIKSSDSQTITHSNLVDIDTYRSYYPRFIKIGAAKESPISKIILSCCIKEEFLFIPKTISFIWLPIESLKSEGKFNQLYIENVNALKNIYCAWRRARGDGNCYYRSVIAGYLLKIFHYSFDKIYANQFIEKLESLISHPNVPGFTSELVYKLKCINSIQDRVERYKEIEKNIQENEFDRWLVNSARFLSELELDNSVHNLGDFIDASDTNDLKNRLRTMGTEAEGIELVLLPKALGIVVEQINFYDNILVSKFPTEDSKGMTISILSKSKGHYDMLLSISDMETEQYHVNELTFYYS